MLVLVRVFIWL